MCRLFVFAMVGNDHPDPDLDWQKHKRGDVIDVLPDGVDGGRGVENDPLFKIIEMPGEPVKGCVSLCMGDPVQAGDLEHPRLRVNRLDLDAIEARASDEKDLAVEKVFTAVDDIITTNFKIVTTKDIVLEVRSTLARQPMTAAQKAKSLKEAAIQAAADEAEFVRLKEEQKSIALDAPATLSRDQ